MTFTPFTPTPPRALALVGMPGAGKSLCAAHLQARGFFQYRFGQIIEDEVVRRGWPVTPGNEQTVREDIRAAEGINAIAERALPHLVAALSNHRTIVIDGLYGFGEYQRLRDGLDASVVVVAVVCARPLRYTRLAARPHRPLSAEEAEARDVREILTLEKGGPIAMADHTLLNDGPPDALLGALDALLAQLAVQP